MFFSLNEYASQHEISRQTASIWLSQDKVAHLKIGNKYYVPDTSEFMENILKERERLITEGNNNLKNIVISIINHKGGVGKSISISNIAASLAFFGFQVLVVDYDPQSNTSNMGKMKHRYNHFKDNNILKLLNGMENFKDENDLRNNIYSTIVNVDSLNFCHKNGKLDLLPNSLDWAEYVEPLLFKANSANYLDMILSTIKDEYDFILVDTAPSLDILWKQAIIASDIILIALKMEEDSVDGLIGVCRATYKLNAAYRDRKKHNIEILGSIVVDYSAHANYSKLQEPALLSVLENDLIYNSEAGIIFEPRISKTVKAAEIQNKRRIALLDEPTNNITDEFLQLTANIVYNIYKSKGVN